MNHSVVIIGAGVFGLTTAIELKSKYPTVSVKILDRSSLPAIDAASTDISKIVRSDYYYDPELNKYAIESINRWKQYNQDNLNSGGEILYNEIGFVSFTADSIDDLNDRCCDEFERVFNDDGRLKLVEEFPGFIDILRNFPFCIVNRQAGWVHATEAMKYLIKRAESLNVEIISGINGEFVKLENKTDTNMVEFVVTRGNNY